MGDSFWLGFFFILVWFVIIGVPCIIISIIGCKMIAKVGQWPSKTPAIYKSVLWKLVIVEFSAFFILGLFYHIFTGEY